MNKLLLSITLCFCLEISRSQNDSLNCINILISEDAAIGFHDNYSTSSNNYLDAVQLAAYCIPGASGGVNTNRAILKFDIPSFFDTVKIISAKLNLYSLGEIGQLSGHTLDKTNETILQKIIIEWNEKTVNWDNQPKVTTDKQVFLPTPNSHIQDFLGIDIIDLFVELQKSNFGLLLRQKSEVPTNALLFCSSDYFDPQKRPNIDICYYTHKKEINSDDNDISVCNIKLLKNPVFDKIILSVQKLDSGNYNIYSISGQYITSGLLTTPYTIIETTNLPPAVYIIELNNCSKSLKVEVLKN